MIKFGTLYKLSSLDKMAAAAASADWSLVDESGRRTRLPQSMVFLGRQDDCDIIIQSRSVDKRHAVFSYDHIEKKFKVKDLTSVNGTFVNGEKLPDDEDVLLNQLDSITFGLDPMVYRVERSGSTLQSITSSSTADMSSETADDATLLSPTRELPSWVTREAGDGVKAHAIAECHGCIAEHGVPHSCGIRDSDSPPASPAPRPARPADTAAPKEPKTPPHPTTTTDNTPNHKVPSSSPGYPHHPPPSPQVQRVYISAAPPALPSQPPPPEYTPRAPEYAHTAPDYFVQSDAASYSPHPPPPTSSRVVLGSESGDSGVYPPTPPHDTCLYHPQGHHHDNHPHHHDNHSPEKSGHSVAASAVYVKRHMEYHEHSTSNSVDEQRHYQDSAVNNASANNSKTSPYLKQRSPGGGHLDYDAAADYHHYHRSVYNYHPQMSHHPHYHHYPPPPPPPTYHYPPPPHYHPACSQCNDAYYHPPPPPLPPGGGAPHVHPPPGPPPTSQPGYLHQHHHQHSQQHGHAGHVTSRPPHADSVVDQGYSSHSAADSSSLDEGSSVSASANTAAVGKICDKNGIPDTSAVVVTKEAAKEDLHSDLESQPVRESEVFAGYGCQDDSSPTSVSSYAHGLNSSPRGGAANTTSVNSVVMTTSTAVSMATVIIEQPTKDVGPEVVVGEKPVGLENGLAQEESTTAKEEVVLDDVPEKEEKKIEPEKDKQGDNQGSSLYGAPNWWGEYEKNNDDTDPNTAEKPNTNNSSKGGEVSVKSEAPPPAAVEPRPLDKYSSDPQYATTYMEISHKHTDESPAPSPEKPPGSAGSPPSQDPAAPTHATPAAGSTAFTIDFGSPDDEPAAANMSATAFTIDFGNDSSSKKGAGMKESKSLSQFLPSKVRRSFKNRAEMEKEKREKRREERDDKDAPTTSPLHQRRRSSTSGVPLASPSQRRRQRPPKVSHQPASVAGYHSEGQGSETSDGEDLSVQSDITASTRGGRRSEPVARGNHKSSLHVKSDQRSPNTAPRRTEAKRGVTTETRRGGGAKKPVPVPSSGTFVIDSHSSSSSAPPTTATTTTKTAKHHDRKVKNVTATTKYEKYEDDNEVPTEFELYREAKSFNAKHETLFSSSVVSSTTVTMEPTSPGQRGRGGELRRSVIRAEQTKRDSAGLNVPVIDDVPDNVSETGTYTIDADDDDAGQEEVVEERSAREEIDSVFCVNGGNTHAAAQNDDTDASDPEEDRGHFIDEDDDWSSTVVNVSSATSTLTASSSSSSTIVSHSQSGSHIEVSGDAPTWVTQWPAIAGSSHDSPPLTSPRALSAASSGRRSSRPGTGRRLPTPPTRPPAAGGSASPTPPGSARSWDFSRQDTSEVEEEGGRARATVTFDSDAGGFFEVSYDAPVVSSPRDRSSSAEPDQRSPVVSAGRRHTTAGGGSSGGASPVITAARRSVGGDSARSTASLDTEVLLQDTEHVIRAMDERRRGHAGVNGLTAASPPHPSELSLPQLKHMADSDSDTEVLVNGATPGHRRGDPPARGVSLDGRGQPVQIHGRAAATKTAAAGKLGSKPGRVRSVDSDNVGVSDDSETASVVSTSTDYSLSSPKPGRKVKASKATISNTRTNRAFALRRQNADSDTEPGVATSGGKRSQSLTRPGSAGSRAGSRPSSACQSPRSSTRTSSTTRSRPSSAKETNRTDASLGTRIVRQSRENQRGGAGGSRAPASGMQRTDGGRGSLRANTAAARDKPKPSTPRSRSTTSPGLKIQGSGAAGSGKTTPTSGARAGGAGSKTQDYEAWKRRKTYDPRKALEEAKSKKEQARRARSAGQTDQWGRGGGGSVSSDNESFSGSAATTPRGGSRRTEDARTHAEILKLSSSITKDLKSLSRQHDSDDERFQEVISSYSATSSFRSLSTSHTSAFSALKPTTSAHAGQEGVTPGGHSSLTSASSASVGTLLAPIPTRRVLSAVGLDESCPTIGQSESYDSLVVTSLYQVSQKVRAHADQILNKLRARGELLGSPSPIDDMLSQNLHSSTPELPQALRNLRHIDAQLTVLERSLLADTPALEVSPRLPTTDLPATTAAPGGSTGAAKRYQRDLGRLTQQAGFKPIERPGHASSSSKATAAHPSTAAKHTTTSHRGGGSSKTASSSWRQHGRQDSNGSSDPLAGSDYY